MVGAGGAVGTLLRAAQNALFAVAPDRLPWITLAQNLTGSFLLGALLALLPERPATSRWARPALGTGLLGGYTTYATVGLELHHLVANGRLGLAAAYLGASAFAGLLVGGAGIAVGRLLARGAR